MQQSKESELAEKSKKAFLRRELVIGIGTTLIFFLSLLFAPLAGIFSSIFSPLPTLLSFYRWGRPEGYGIPLGAALAGWLILSYFGLTHLMFYFMEMILLGLLLADGMRRQWSPEKTIVRASLILFIMGSFVFWFTYGGSEGGVFKDLEKNLLAITAEVLQRYREFFPQQHLPEEQLRKAIVVMVRLIPGMALASTLMVAWLNVLLAKRFCRVHHLPLPPWQEWSRWKAPEYLVWGAIASGFFVLLPSTSLQILGLNVLIVCSAVYLLQGLAIVVFYFERWQFPPFFRGILYVVIFLQQIVTLGVVLVGLFDMWFDFRRLSKPSPPDHQA